ncbi:MAG TPA: thioredoxin domain-containing protein [Candidatus Thermoplasmatota archaeon]|nr:thioredoxin domain-containing protein [Candidatus Thermoplasmatota archaeon]
MDDDPELAAIRARKLAELQQRAAQPRLDHPVVVTDATLPAFVAEHPIAAVDCWAAWCGPCRLMDPVIESLARELAGRVAFGKLNVDENPGASERFGVASIPTLLVFRAGKLAGEVIGAVPAAVVRAKLGV